ncbi:beta galactosidase jelly roll domain-containing protein [Amycolatopsis kentuckyensis]|uniref:beta galactosidase jelly roll domain-containing protein n=1 Tax=Amycolatopsis kentuckyensis TaxID=218823 RepID=UPI0035625D35
MRLAASRPSSPWRPPCWACPPPRPRLFLNGWNVGQYVADVGPQHTFALPAGVLDPHGRNTLALAVTSDGGAGNGLEHVALTDLGSARGGVPVRPVYSPRWRPW